MRVGLLAMLATPLLVPAGRVAGQGTGTRPPAEQVVDLAHLFAGVEEATAVVLDAVWEEWPPGRRAALAFRILREVGSLDAAWRPDHTADHRRKD